ncbi:MAG: HAMP domain-containing sensor histidine kinase [Verrucomicrobiota bacterium]
MSSGETKEKERDPTIAWSNFVKFVRQLSHDLRNQLNAAELQAALLNEISTDPELKDEVKRLRTLISQLGSTLQHLSSSVAAPRPTTIDYPAAELVEDLRKKITQSLPEKAEQIRWGGKPEGVSVKIDPNLIEVALVELLNNAFQHGRALGKIEVISEASNGEFALSVIEPKAEPVDTTAGAFQTLGSASHGHYALGRHRAQSILEAHAGRLETAWDPASKSFRNRLVLPCSSLAD